MQCVLDKVLSCSYCEILQCQNVFQCWSLYDCQTHKLLRPNGWLGSRERTCCLLLGREVFLKNNEPFLGKGDFQFIHVIWVLVIYDRTSMLTNFDVSCDAKCAICCGKMADKVHLKGNIVYYHMVKYLWKKSRFWERWLPIHPRYLGLVGDIWSHKYAY